MTTNNDYKISGEMMEQDRRKISRVPVFFVLEKLNFLSDSNREEECQGIIKNITPDGLLLETNWVIKKNDLLSITITLPNINKTLNIESRVCWVEAQKAWNIAGLEFMDLSSNQRDSIMEYLLTLDISV